MIETWMNKKVLFRREKLEEEGRKAVAARDFDRMLELYFPLIGKYFVRKYHNVDAGEVVHVMYKAIDYAFRRFNCKRENANLHSLLTYKMEGLLNNVLKVEKDSNTNRSERDKNWYESLLVSQGKK